MIINDCVYLCGPILNCKDNECISWRKEATKYLKHTFDPMIRDYRNSHGDHIEEIVTEDKRMIDASFALLVKFDYPSVGTSMEILYAWERKKFIVTVVEDKEKVLSPWLIYHSTHIVHSFEDAYKLINSEIRKRYL